MGGAPYLSCELKWRASAARWKSRLGSTPRASAGEKPVFINAGDGRHEHPTQEFLDEFTFLEQRGWDDSHIHVALIGDLFHGRTVHSKADGLNVFRIGHRRSGCSGGVIGLCRHPTRVAWRRMVLKSGSGQASRSTWAQAISATAGISRGCNWREWAMRFASGRMNSERQLHFGRTGWINSHNTRFFHPLPATGETCYPLRFSMEPL